MEGQGAGFEAPSRGFKSYVKRSSSARWAGVDHPPSSSLRPPEGPATLLGSPSTTAITCDAVVEWILLKTSCGTKKASLRGRKVARATDSAVLCSIMRAGPYHYPNRWRWAWIVYTRKIMQDYVCEIRLLLSWIFGTCRYIFRAAPPNLRRSPACWFYNFTIKFTTLAVVLGTKFNSKFSS